MPLCNAALVIADISGYTNFIKTNKASLVHAAEVISQLLEAVTEGASHPLVLNKLEGDAAFLYADLQQNEEAGARDVALQVRSLFPLFKDTLARIAIDRAACPCDACRSIGKLQLKAVVHKGLVVVRRIRQFEELTGEDVILVHRLLKNTIPGHEYIAMTNAFHGLSGDLAGMRREDRDEHCDDVGLIGLRVFYQEQESLIVDAPDDSVAR